MIRVDLIFVVEFKRGAPVFGRFGFTDKKLMPGAELVLADLSIEQLVLYGAIELIDCDNFEEGSADQFLIPGRNFGQTFRA